MIYTSGKFDLRERTKTLIELAVPGKAVWMENSRCIAVLVKNPNCEIYFKVLKLEITLIYNALFLTIIIMLTFASYCLQ